MAKKITVIGGGMGGYGAAIRAAQLGAQVTLIEKDAMGGTCLNRGCIPTKALLQSANMLALIKRAPVFGITAKDVSLDFGAVMKRKEAIVSRMVSGVNSLMRKNKIKVIKGTGTITDPKTVTVLETKEQITGDNIIIATGSRPSKIPINGIDEPGVITSDEALSLKELPKSIFIIGAGVIGMEFAQVFNEMGAKVTVGEVLPNILPNEDSEIAKILEELVKKRGVEIFTETRVTAIEPAGTQKKVRFSNKSGDQERLVDLVLVAVGRQCFTEGLGLDKIGAKMERGRLTVNDRLETSIPGIFAVGDVVGKAMLAHVAMSEGICAAENIMGMNSKLNYSVVPHCTYTSPEVASVGMTEAEARKQDPNIKVGRFPVAANGRAVILDEAEGLVKIFTNKYGEILGVSMVGPEATELIAEATFARHIEATVDDLISCIHAHPTVSEVMREAAMSAEGKAVHI